MSRIQLAASGGGEWARPEKFSRAGGGEIAIGVASITGTETIPKTSCCFASALRNGCEIGALFPLDFAQQVLFAQQRILQGFSLGAFERMHEAAGN